MGKSLFERYTSIGVNLFRWEPLVECSGTARWLWLSCYAGGDAKLGVPGLFNGDIYSMVSACRFPLNETWNALDNLIDHELVTFDPKNRLLRYLKLPDAHDRAHTFQAISGWFTRFCALAPCPQRDAHVPLLWWMVSQGEVNEKMTSMWQRTFGTIVIPTHLPVFGSPSSSDTGTRVQPSLFGQPSQPLLLSSNDSRHLNPSGLPCDHGTFPEQDQDLVLEDPDQRPEPAGDRDRGPHLRLVSDDEIVRAEREAYARDMKAAIVEAGGGTLLGS